MPSSPAEAWQIYLETIRGLQGVEYEEAERLAWKELQKRLRAAKPKVPA